MANLQDRSTPTEARWTVRWTDGRARPERSYTFSSPPARRGQSDAEKAARRLKAYLDLMGHHLEVLEALVAAGVPVRDAGGRRARRPAHRQPGQGAGALAEVAALGDEPGAAAARSARSVVEDVIVVLGADGADVVEPVAGVQIRRSLDEV